MHILVCIGWIVFSLSLLFSLYVSLALSHSPYMKLIFCLCLSTSKILFPYVHIYVLQSYITKI